MATTKTSRFLDRRGTARRAGLAALRHAVTDGTYVSIGSRRTASPHEFYRYPARFPPAFARAAIDLFTDVGDYVLDPFVGGGTTLVEARLAGRPAVGADLNQLAVFVSRAKARPCSPEQIAAMRRWANRVPERTNVHRSVAAPVEWAEDGYHFNIDDGDLWRVRKFFSLALGSLSGVPAGRARDLARCAILRCGQWALDMRSEIPTITELRDALVDVAVGMSDAAEDYADEVRAVDATYNAGQWRTAVVEQGLPGLARRISDRVQAPRLILTSPPYPGVYVNYHRWKVQGRWETPAPFWLADRRDGNGITYYTMAARTDPTLDRYFDQLEAAFGDLAELCDSSTVVVQMVGFHNPTHDLPRYLLAMKRSGFTEVRLPELATRADGRLWRHVPNRRWWTVNQPTAANTAREVVLFHRFRW